ncbi:MAG: hypothetical protein ACYDDF_08735 [Thermoplasmatota archaeon]
MNWKRSANPLTSGADEAEAESTPKSGKARQLPRAAPIPLDSEMQDLEPAALEELEDVGALEEPTKPDAAKVLGAAAVLAEPGAKKSTPTAAAAAAAMPALVELKDGPREPSNPSATNPSLVQPTIGEPGSATLEARKLAAEPSFMPPLAPLPSVMDVDSIHARIAEAQRGFAKALEMQVSTFNAETSRLREAYDSSITQMAERLSQLEESLKERDAQLAAKQEETSRLRDALKKVISEAFEIVKDPEPRKEGK